MTQCTLGKYHVLGKRNLANDHFQQIQQIHYENSFLKASEDKYMYDAL